jgi:hypothetical protein
MLPSFPFPCVLEVLPLGAARAGRETSPTETGAIKLTEGFLYSTALRAVTRRIHTAAHEGVEIGAYLDIPCSPPRILNTSLRTCEGKEQPCLRKQP